MENGGLVRTSFSFKNISKGPIKISKVSTGCGCTSSNWPKDEIAPGATKAISVTFDPKDRPGIFEKNIDVVLANNTHIPLTITGTVVPAEKGSLPREIFPAFSGNLWFEAPKIPSGYIYNDTSIVVKTKVYNPTKRPITIDWDRSTFPAFIRPKLKGKQMVPAKDSAQIAVIYDGRKRKDWGYMEDKFTLATNDTDTPRKDVTILIYLHERLNESAAGPSLQLSGNTHDFGKTTQGSTKRGMITFTNTGHKPLFIRKIFCSAENLSFKIPQEGIAPKGTASIEVNFKAAPSLGTGPVSQLFVILSNDPRNRSQLYRITANIALPGK